MDAIQNNMPDDKSTDKNQPGANAGETDKGTFSEQMKREAGQPGGQENASGTEANDDHEHRLGAGPIPTDALNTGEKK